MIRAGFAWVILALTSAAAFGQTTQRFEFDTGWRFHLGEASGAEAAAFDDSQWRQLDLPHDWSIEGPYSADAPTGGGGGYLPTGIGWYRKHFTLPQLPADRSVWVEFDGVYENSDVWLNGRTIGKRPFGYISFHYDLTPFLVNGTNVIAVRVDNSHQPNSRWYSGSGIYRHVGLIITGNIHVAHWGVYVTTPEVSAASATINVRTLVENRRDVAWGATIRTALLDPQGKELTNAEASCAAIEPGRQTPVEQQMKIDTPHLWSVETPVLYSLRTTILVDGTPTDEVATPFGIRKIEYDVDRGFLLNGKHVKMNGVCLHHDGGCVGAAVPIGVWQRRLATLKAMGCNAIRTSHNPPAPEFLDLCDRMGFLVMDEAFDEWKIGKTQYGYNKYFDGWAEKDLTAMLHRDRNHPSVVMWSVGNEIREQPRPGGEEPLKALVAICHKEDPNRPVTLGCDNIAADGGSTTLPFLESLDIVGYNYVDRWHERRELYYSIDRQGHPKWRFVGTESTPARGFRNAYSLGNDPATVRPNYTTGMIRAEQLWKFVATRGYVIGDFMWTGIDYLGETRWPSRLAASGVLDLCGFPKDNCYFYQSQWTQEPMVFLFPHWNWTGREGQPIPVLAYSNCDAVELFLNGKSLGEKRLEFPRQGNSGSWNRYDRPPVNATTADLHLSWDVPYTPGTLKAVGRRAGRVVCMQEVRTAGAPAAIRLSADPNTIKANGTDVVHVRVEILDANEVLVPTADNLVKFAVEGQGRLIGVDNGNPMDRESYQVPQRRAYGGLCLAIVQSLRKEGKIQITAQAEGLKSALIEVEVQACPLPPSL
jgi:beta-galactosidase